MRSFSSKLDDNRASRSIDNDAPAGLRQEFIDAVYLIFERAPKQFDERKLYNIISQSLGIQPSGNPYSGFRYAVSRDVNKAPRERFYDLIIRIAAEVPAIFTKEYREIVNQLLASYGIVWELREYDQLHRVLPPVVTGYVEAAFRKLGKPRFSAALASFQAGMAAYNARPQRGRDTCKNIFDALESVAKEVFAMPTITFGNVLAEARKRQSMTDETISILQKIYDMANSHFRHGMTRNFVLKPAEVDYVLVSCVGAILLFIRL
ncbi:MAG: hypothetical protein ABSG32_23075 [Terriglobia bacterium]|jgi:hypothetical protein